MDIIPGSDEHVYLVDHAWTYRTEQARHQLNTIPGLAARLANLMDLEMVSSSQFVRLEFIKILFCTVPVPYPVFLSVLLVFLRI